MKIQLSKSQLTTVIISVLAFMFLTALEFRPLIILYAIIFIVIVAWISIRAWFNDN